MPLHEVPWASLDDDIAILAGSLQIVWVKKAIPENPTDLADAAGELGIRQSLNRIHAWLDGVDIDLLNCTSIERNRLGGILHDVKRVEEGLANRGQLVSEAGQLAESLTHGLRWIRSRDEKKAPARPTIADPTEAMTTGALAKQLGVSRECVGKWIRATPPRILAQKIEGSRAYFFSESQIKRIKESRSR